MKSRFFCSWTLQGECKNPDSTFNVPLVPRCCFIEFACQSEGFFKSRSIRLIASSLLSPCQNNGTYVLKLHISPSAFILTKADDYNSRDLQGSTGVVTLLLPSTRPQIFTYTVQLYSVEGAQHSFVSCLERKIHVPGPCLEEYQEGPAIEHPIRKIRPRGQLL